MKAKQLKEVGVLTGCVQVRESLVGDFIETQVLAGQLTGMKTGELC
jgi:predicted HAD superfamily phosphohydrolase YqeG